MPSSIARRIVVLPSRPRHWKRKRVRIAKKDTDRVYTVNGREGENFDVKKNKIKNEAPPSSRICPLGCPRKKRSPQQRKNRLC